MPSYLAHLITNPDAPITPELARRLEAHKRNVPRRVRRARRLEVTGKGSPTVAQPAPRPQPVDKPVTPPSGDLAAWWAGASDGASSITGLVRLAARTFPDMPRAEFIAAMVSLGVNKSTAGVQFGKARN